MSQSAGLRASECSSSVLLSDPLGDCPALSPSAPAASMPRAPLRRLARSQRVPTTPCNLGVQIRLDPAGVTTNLPAISAASAHFGIDGDTPQKRGMYPETPIEWQRNGNRRTVSSDRFAGLLREGVVRGLQEITLRDSHLSPAQRFRQSCVNEIRRRSSFRAGSLHGLR
jgi:hypothetical protein